MRTKNGKIATPIRELMDGESYGRVIFRVSDFRQQFNTRTAALGHKSRHGYDLYTMANGEKEIHVIRKGREDMPGMVVDLS